MASNFSYVQIGAADGSLDFFFLDEMSRAFRASDFAL